MKKFTLYIISFISLLLFGYEINAQVGEMYPNDIKKPIVKIYSSGKIENFRVEAQKRIDSKQAPTANFKVIYHGFSEEAKVAFSKAVELWSYLIHAHDTIIIDATWKPLDPGVLGSCGAENYFRNFKNAPIKNTWYPVAIANKLAGFDLDPDAQDITANFSSSFSWYLGTDGNCPPDKFDFVSIVLHELGHGLGFIGSGNMTGSSGSWGYGTTSPFIFDRYVYDVSDQAVVNKDIFDNPSVELGNVFTSNDLFFISELGNNANGDAKVELYAPSSWNPGSSYSHLGEIFNGTINSLMTYSSGYAEVVHDPGPIVLGMFAEMGWIHPLMKHSQIKDRESMAAPLNVELEIDADSSIKAGSVKMHYSTDNFATDNIVVMSTTDDIIYNGEIPAINNDTVKYYFECENTLDRIYYYPVQGQMEVTNIDTTFSFIIGEDNTSPELIHDNKYLYVYDLLDSLQIDAISDDNVGLDSVYIEYKVNENTLKHINLGSLGINQDGLLDYSTKIPLVDEVLNDLDTIYYKLTAVDISLNKNSITLPESGFYKIPVYTLLETQIDTILDFDQQDGNDLFILDGFSIDQPANFDNNGLHTLHPYAEGNIYSTATLKMPIRIAEFPNLVFDEVVIVEPGESGTSYGDEEFWDYVVVEGSNDFGNTWHEFEDGYDSKISTAFLSAYNTSSVGQESMYQNHKIEFLENQYFEVDDTILIRFKLWSDAAATAWGWAIDNIKIQKDAVAPSAPTGLIAYEVNDTSISLKWNKAIDNIAVTSYLVYQNAAFVSEVTDTTFKATNLSRGTTYSYYVKAKDAMGNISATSNVVYQGTTTSIANIYHNIKKCDIYPNPSEGVMSLQFKTDFYVNNVDITVYSIDGRLVYSKDENVSSDNGTISLNLSSLNKGQYIVRINFEKELITRKIIIE